MINKRSPIPIYYQIENYIRNLIEENQFKPGDSIPTEKKFTELFNVSRMTVRQAISNLVNDGVLYRQKGKGTFVSETKIEQPLNGVTSFSEEMLKRGMTPSSRLLSFNVIQAGQETSSMLGIRQSEPVYEIKRIRLANNVPIALEWTYVSERLAQGLTADKVMDSLYSFIEKSLGFKIVTANQVIEAALAGQDEVEHLNLDCGSPILLIHRNTFLENGQPLEWVRSVYRADRYKFIINMKRD